MFSVVSVIINRIYEEDSALNKHSHHGFSLLFLSILPRIFPAVDSKELNDVLEALFHLLNRFATSKNLLELAVESAMVIAQDMSQNEGFLDLFLLKALKLLIAASAEVPVKVICIVLWTFMLC